MKVPSRKQALPQIVERLADLLDVPSGRIKARQDGRAPDIDAVIQAGAHRLVVQWNGSGSTAAVASAADQTRQGVARIGKTALSLVAVPFMGNAGKAQCERAGVSWIDLSGNAAITGPGLRIRIEGQPNRFKRPGRPASVFAPKSARIARWLLIHPDRAVTQREIARATDMDEGFTSRIVARLEQEGFVKREPDGAIRASDPSLLLDAWREMYDFSKHELIRGHVAARSGDELLPRLADALTRLGTPYAATGLAAAWQHTRFAAFRIVTLFLDQAPPAEILARISFRLDERGANVWLAVPSDAGVFLGAAEHDGVRCVHPVQTYLDLQHHPERAHEAAEHLRAELLRWMTDD